MIETADGDGWWREARCRQFPDLPWVDVDIDPMLVGAMIEVCRRCPAVTSCARYVVELEQRGAEVVGVWAAEVRLGHRELVGV